MAIVDDVLFAVAELKENALALSRIAHGACRTAYVFANDGAQALNPENTSSSELTHEESFTGEHGFAEGLRLVVLGHASRASQERVLAGTPSILPREANISDIAKREGSKQQLARTRVSRHGHFTTSDKLLHAEFHSALESHGRRHGDHGARLHFQRTAYSELDGDDGVAVAVGDAVAAAIKSAYIVDGRARTGEMTLRRSAAGHLRLSADVDGTLWLFLLFLGI